MAIDNVHRDRKDGEDSPEAIAGDEGLPGSGDMATQAPTAMAYVLPVYVPWLWSVVLPCLLYSSPAILPKKHSYSAFSLIFTCPMKQGNLLEMGMIMIQPGLCMALFSFMGGSYWTEFPVVVLSQYFSLLFPGLIPWHFVLVLLLLLVLALLLRSSSSRHGKLAHDKTHQSCHEPCIVVACNLMRTIMMVTVTTCILMCDFSFWTARLGKSDGYGYGFMDFGVAAFLYNAGLFSTKLKSTRRAKAALIMCLLGFVRLFTVRSCKLDVNPREYGCHMNFYFLMAIMNLLSLTVRTDSGNNLWLALLLLAVHSVLVWLFRGTILSDDRSGFIMQNKEGLFSITPYFAFYLFSNTMGSIILSPAESLISKAEKSLCYSGHLYFVYVLLYCVEQPCRRLCNTLFLIQSALMCTYFTAACILLVCWFPRQIGRFRCLHFISRNSLGLFLGSNLLLLACKLLFDLDSCGFYDGNLINLGYLAANHIVYPLLKERLARRMLRGNAAGETSS